MTCCGSSQISISAAFLVSALLSSLILIIHLHVQHTPTVRVPNNQDFHLNQAKNIKNNLHVKEQTSLSTAVEKICSLPVEKRFDCARDRTLTRVECETRGCCYVPLVKSGFSGPPWCFYPGSFPGYKMGPLLPTPKGQKATLTRTAPSYLPGDVTTLQLDVMSDDPARLHLTVSGLVSLWTESLKK